MALTSTVCWSHHRDSKKGHRYPTIVQTHTGDIVRAIYNFQFDEMAQCGKPVVSPWLVKWKKVAPPKTVQRELPYFAVAQMAAIVKGAKTQLNRALFALAAGSGARAGELFALRVETDLNLDERMITIRVTRTGPALCLLTPP